MANATRRQAREWALQMLFQADLNPGLDLDMTIPKFWMQQFTYKTEEAERTGEPSPEASQKSPEDRVAPPKMRLFAEVRVRGVMAHLKEIDEQIQKHAAHWEIYRLGTIERNVLRLAYYELAYTDVPAPVVLNEAIDLAKYFSNAEAGRFVNGVLDKMRKDLEESRKGKPAVPPPSKP